MICFRILFWTGIAALFATSCKQIPLERKLLGSSNDSTVISITQDTASGQTPHVPYTTSSHNSGTNIFVAGYFPSGDHVAACYWKNDQFIPLPLPASVTNSLNSQAWAVSLSQNDVYIAGEVTTPERSYAVYWKNEVPVIVDDGGTHYAHAFGLAVSGDDVFIAGTADGQAAYWKNGALNRLDGNLATCIFVSGDDVYVGGNIDTTAVYWKNGQMNKLKEGNYVAGIGVIGNDVYVTGMHQAAVSQAFYWKNGVATMLSTNSEAYALTVDGSDVYILGSDTDNSLYWKNGQQFSFIKDSMHPASQAISIAVFQGIVYVAGAIDYATYWKDGLATTLQPGNLGNGIAVRN